MKKLLAIVISMAMVLAMLPVGVFAEGGNDEGNTETQSFMPYLVNAPLHNNGGSDDGLFTEYDYSAEGNENGAIFEVDVNELKSHKNGNNQEGKWVGIAIEIPEGATTVQYKINDGEVIPSEPASCTTPDYTTTVTYNDGTTESYKCMTLYWDYTAKDVQKISVKYNNTNWYDIAVVVNSENTNEVAKIGNRYFATLAEAIAAVSYTDVSNTDTTLSPKALPDATTITLLKDTKGGFDIGTSNGKQAKNIILDLNEKTLTLGPPVGSTGTVTNGMRVLWGSKAKVINGTISATTTEAEKIKVGIANYGTLELENILLNHSGTVKSDDLTGQWAYSINNAGNLTIKNTKINNSVVVMTGGGEAISDHSFVLVNGNYWAYDKAKGIADIDYSSSLEGTIFIGSVPEDKVSELHMNGVLNGKLLFAEPDENEVRGNVVLPAGKELKEISANQYIISTPYVPSTPSTPTDNVTNDTTDKNTTADLNPTVSGDKANTTVDADTAAKIVDKAVANKSTEVIIDAAGNNNVAASEVGIPEATVKELSEKTDANLVIKTDNGKVDLDKTALDAVAAQAGTTGTVKLIVETVKTDANICHVDLKLVTSNGNVTDFKGGNVKVTVSLNKELAGKELVCVYINDNGIYTKVDGVLNADGTYTFTTGHFSEYAVMAKDEADKAIADQLNTLIKEVSLTARTSKTAKKNIKVTVNGDVTALKDAGYTVKYKFYRSTKKASKYVALKTKDTNTYTNTIGKKGTKYYYKAKVLVYDGDTLVAQTALKQCKYGARFWTK